MWLYIPPTSPSTREAECSMRDLDKDSLASVCRSLSQSVMWRETLKQERYWLTKYSQESWTKHLYGLIPTPSTASRSLEKWMQSSEVFPASPGQLPGAGKGKKTKGGSGTISRESLLRYDLDSSSWKTSQVSLWEEDSAQFLETLPKSGTMQNGYLYPQPKWERPTNVKESSSWPTPTARDYKDVGPNTNYKKIADKVRLAGAAMTWEAQNWITPNTMDTLPPKSQETLDREATRTRKGRKTPANLRDQVNVFHKQATWATTEKDQLLHQDQTIQSGTTSSNTEETSPQQPQKLLNPKFVEWLMGWQENWIRFHVLGYSDTSETE